MRAFHTNYVASRKPQKSTRFCLDWSINTLNVNYELEAYATLNAFNGLTFFLNHYHYTVESTSAVTTWIPF
nr:hypothetical protein CFP56_25075 [Quercus suber]